MIHKYALKLSLAAIVAVALTTPVGMAAQAAGTQPDQMAQIVLAQHNREVVAQAAAQRGASANTSAQPVLGAMPTNIRTDRRRNLNGLAINWWFVPTNDAVPGTLWDPDPNNVQDWGLNSSVLVQVTRDGQPVKGVSVSWAASDDSAKIQAGMPTTDTDGTARAWYWVGSGQNQTITAKIVGTTQSISANVPLNLTASPDHYQLETPFAMFGGGSYQTAQTSANSVTVTPKSDLPWSQFVINNHSQEWNGLGFSSSFSLQLSSYDCGDPFYADLCAKPRGKARGHVVTFGAWPATNDYTAPSSIQVPVVVSTGVKTVCQTLDWITFENGAAGSWQYCEAPGNWAVNSKATYITEDLGGAPAGWQRVRASQVNADGSKTEIVTMDIPSPINFGSSFLQSSGPWLNDGLCLAAPKNAITVNALKVQSGGVWSDLKTGTGLINDWSMNGCQNYQISVDESGLTLATGGRGWMDIEPVINSVPFAKFLHFGKGYTQPNGPLWNSVNIDLTKKSNN